MKVMTADKENTSSRSISLSHRNWLSHKMTHTLTHLDLKCSWSCY